MIELGVVSATPTDWLRLLVVPVIGWTAYRDLQVRRVPNATWVPLAVLAVATLVADAMGAWGGDWTGFAFPLAISVGFVVPLAYAFWYFGAFGGADAKALLLFALLYPTYPAYLFTREIAGVPGALPAQEAPLGVFSFTILTNAVVAGVAYPVAVLAGNLVRGRIGRRSWMGYPIDPTSATETHGKLLETDGDGTRRGLDLDALRMYLRWRGITLDALLADPDRFRDRPPEDPNDPGDGAVDSYDEGVDLRDDPDTGGSEPSERRDDDGGETKRSDDDTQDGDPDDPWGAEAFLEDAEGAYGTDAETLRGGLDILVERDEVWVTPGIPFMVPLFLGLLAAVTVGDLLYAALGLVAVGP